MCDLKPNTSVFVFRLQAYIYKQYSKMIKSSLLITALLSQKQFSKLLAKIDSRKHVKPWNCGKNIHNGFY